MENKPTKGRTTTSITLDNEVLARLDSVAERLRRTRSDVVEELLENGLPAVERIAEVVDGMKAAKTAA